MPGPGPTLTQLAQNVGEGVKASENQLRKFDQTNGEPLGVCDMVELKIGNPLLNTVKFFGLKRLKPFNVVMASYLDLHGGSLELEPLVNPSGSAGSLARDPVENPSETPPDNQPSSEPGRANDAGDRPETLPAGPPHAARRRRVLNLAEGEPIGIA